MYNMLIDILIWSFAIFGMYKFLEDNFYDIVCYIIQKSLKIVAFFKNIIAKISGKMYNRNRKND